jgi:pantetheine-phosphate adenylyltransferase
MDVAEARDEGPGREQVRLAVYPGAFDPITNGHLDVARRAAALFDSVIIAVYDGPPKRGALFTTEERVGLVATVVADHASLSAQSYSGLTIEFAHQVGATALVRGLRIGADFEYELQLAHMYRKLAPQLEVVCLMTSAQYSFVSSSLVREVASLGGDITDFVPQAVAAALVHKLGNREPHD